LKVCIFGAGAIGGFLGVHLAAAGAQVSLVARGAHLDAMRPYQGGGNMIEAVHVDR
jgi:2-dehydropantoate 2-reductase